MRNKSLADRYKIGLSEQRGILEEQAKPILGTARSQSVRGGWKRRVRRVVRRVADPIPPTWRGVLVVALSVVALWVFGYQALDRVLYILGLMGLILVCVTALTVGVTGLVMSRKLRPEANAARRLEAGSPIRTGFKVPALGNLPLVQIGWEWTTPPAVEVRMRLVRGVLFEEVVAQRRCHLPSIGRRFAVHDPFGLNRVHWETSEATAVTILPNVGRLRNMPVVQSMAGGEGLPYPTGSPEGDRMDIRRYVPGDSVRNILWKTYARTRLLNVRTPERAVARSRKTVAYLMTGPGDEPAAAAARVAVEAGVLGQKWLFGADGANEPTDEPQTAILAIARSGSLPPDSIEAERGLLGFLELVSGEGAVHCVVFAPAREGPWLQRVREAAKRFPGTMSFVLGTDGVIRRTELPMWRRLLVAEEESIGTPAPELAGLLRQLAELGGETLVVDRLSGRPYTQAHQRGLGSLRG